MHECMYNPLLSVPTLSIYLPHKGESEPVSVSEASTPRDEMHPRRRGVPPIGVAPPPPQYMDDSADYEGKMLPPSG